MYYIILYFMVFICNCMYYIIFWFVFYMFTNVIYTQTFIPKDYMLMVIIQSSDRIYQLERLRVQEDPYLGGH